MEERKDNKGLASLEDILNNTAKNLNDTSLEEELKDNSEEDSSSIFDEIYGVNSKETEDDTEAQVGGEDNSIIEPTEPIQTIDENNNSESLESPISMDAEEPELEPIESAVSMVNETEMPVPEPEMEPLESPLSMELEETNPIINEVSAEEPTELEPLETQTQVDLGNEEPSLVPTPEIEPEQLDPIGDFVPMEPSEPNTASIFEKPETMESSVDVNNTPSEDIASLRERVMSKKIDDSNNGYVGFEKRIAIYSVAFVVLFMLGGFLIIKSLYVDNAQYINYTETSNIDYKVYLKENSFYDEAYLDKGMLYVASLIDHIDIDFLYNFNISEKVKLDFDYNLVGVLSITDTEGKKTYLKKEYELMPKKKFSMGDSQDHTITENLIIDYNQYNQIANSFKATYGVDTNSKLAVYFKADRVSSDNSLENVAQENNLLMEIPLSERSVSISMDYKNINNNSQLVKKKSISIGNIILLLIAIGVIGVSIVSLVKLLKLFGVLNDNKTLHDKYVNKIMKQYDRLIVEHFTCPDLNKYNNIKIKDFNELLDMRDNLKSPILYYNAVRHEKSYFYIQNYKDLYLLVIKNVDLENEKNNKK